MVKSNKSAKSYKKKYQTNNAFYLHKLREEDKFQMNCKKWLKKHYSHVAWFHPKNNVEWRCPKSREEAKEFRIVQEMVGSRNKQFGVRKGIPDIVFPVAKVTENGRVYGGLYLELKTKNGHLHGDQPKIKRKLEEHDQLVVIVRSEEDFKREVTNYMNLKSPNEQLESSDDTEDSNEIKKYKNREYINID